MSITNVLLGKNWAISGCGRVQTNNSGVESRIVASMWVLCSKCTKTMRLMRYVCICNLFGADAAIVLRVVPFRWLKRDSSMKFVVVFARNICWNRYKVLVLTTTQSCTCEPTKLHISYVRAAPEKQHIILPTQSFRFEQTEHLIHWCELMQCVYISQMIHFKYTPPTNRPRLRWVTSRGDKARCFHSVVRLCSIKTLLRTRIGCFANSFTHQCIDNVALVHFKFNDNLINSIPWFLNIISHIVVWETLWPFRVCVWLQNCIAVFYSNLHGCALGAIRFQRHGRWMRWVRKIFHDFTIIMSILGWTFSLRDDANGER